MRLLYLAFYYLLSGSLSVFAYHYYHLTHQQALNKFLSDIHNSELITAYIVYSFIFGLPALWALQFVWFPEFSDVISSDVLTYELKNNGQFLYDKLKMANELYKKDNSFENLQNLQIARADFNYFLDNLSRRQHEDLMGILDND